ncbi:MAG: ferrous iron transport protein B [Planctomycetaceae bacterium]|jgi:ferrous iron transport protein B|nr:ferrous iron transport protein B [Planctomycetaceae bacterium]
MTHTYKHHHTDLLVVLTGQPNTGKSTLFTLLTGLHQDIGNYPGVTVEKKTGHFSGNGQNVEVVDLPGIYSLESYSPEERVTRNFILLERPEVIVVVLDASNLQRHLHLALQLLELEVPTVICLNMTDMAEHWGLEVDAAALEKMIGVPVIPAVASSGKGIAELKKTILEVAEKTQQNEHCPTGWHLDYGTEIESALAPITQSLSAKEHLMEDFAPRWLALRLLEGDSESQRIVQHHTHEPGWESLLKNSDDTIASFEKTHKKPLAKLMTAKRNEYANNVAATVVKRVRQYSRKSDLIDTYACHPFYGLALVLAIVSVVFYFVFHLAQEWTWIPAYGNDGLAWVSPCELTEIFFGDILPTGLNSILQLEEGTLVYSALYDAIIGGVGGVLTFVPIIFFMFLFLAILERVGYIARMVVVFDRLLRIFGLHGQSVLPLVMAGGIVNGCAVPAIMATRSMKEPRERLITIMVLPLMNCGAKVPVYMMLIGAFFAAYQVPMMLGLVAASWSLALLSALVLSKTLVRGKHSPLLLELPPYRRPTVIAVLYSALLNSWWFIKKAGTIILMVNVILWVAMTFPRTEGADSRAQLENSLAGRVGKLLEPIGRYAGFDWRDNIALAGGFAAKEVILSTMETMYQMENENYRESETVEPKLTTISGLFPEEQTGQVSETSGVEQEEDDLERATNTLKRILPTDPQWSMLKAISMMIFIMVYAPCTATVGVIWRETSFKWAMITLIYTTVLAWILAVAIYQIGMMFV